MNFFFFFKQRKYYIKKKKRIQSWGGINLTQQPPHKSVKSTHKGNTTIISLHISGIEDPTRRKSGTKMNSNAKQTNTHQTTIQQTQHRIQNQIAKKDDV
jgi:hypothetical protein